MCFSPTRDGNEYNLVSIARALYIYTNRKIGNCITQHHIKSHSSHPLNEFVDDLCTHFLKCQESPFEPIPCYDINTLNVKCAHAFLMKDIPQISSSMDYPDIFDSNYYHVSDDTIASAIDVEHEELPCNFIPAYINIIQYNVLSLKEDRDKFAWILTTYNNALALCQETRSKTAGIKFNGNFIVVSSAAVNGVYGCEIWINTKISFGKLYNKNVYINSIEDVSIVLTDPRFLTISIAHGPLFFAATSAHAPYNKPIISSEVKDWWKEFSKQYNDIANKFQNRVLGIDANQKHGVTNPSSPVYDKLFGQVGRHSPVHSSFAFFLEFCQKIGETPASTIDAHCDNGFVEHPFTYIHKASWDLSVIDYLLTSSSVQIKPKSCCRNEHLVLNSLCDHIPLVMSVKFLPLQQHIFKKRRKLGYNPELIGLPSYDSVFVKNVASIKQPNFNTDTTSHCWLLEEQIRECLTLAYPVSKLPPRKNKYISDFTFSLIQQHRFYIKNYFKPLNQLSKTKVRYT